MTINKKLLQNTLMTLFVVLTVTGCTNTAKVESAKATEMHDPYENFNRKMFTFNTKLDEYALKPVAKQYAKLPEPVKTGVANVFDNLREPSNVVNNLLQGKYQESLESGIRFVFNTTFGLGGIIDWMTPAGLPEHREDFSQTLAGWGVQPGPFIMYPFFGPSTLRDTARIPTQYFLSPLTYIDDQGFWIEAAIYGVDLVNSRAAFLPYDEAFKLQLDPYMAMRNLYYENRRKLIYDGNVPKKGSGDKFDDEFDDDFDDEFNEPASQSSEQASGGAEDKFDDEFDESAAE